MPKTTSDLDGLRRMTAQDLQQELKIARKEIIAEKLRLSLGAEKSTKQLHQSKKRAAHILTVLAEQARELKKSQKSATVSALQS